MGANVPVTRSSIRKNYIFLPLFDAVKDLIAESMANEDAEDTAELLDHEERYFETVPAAEQIDEGREEDEEDW